MDATRSRTGRSDTIGGGCDVTMDSLGFAVPLTGFFFIRSGSTCNVGEFLGGGVGGSGLLGRGCACFDSKRSRGVSDKSRLGDSDKKSILSSLTSSMREALRRCLIVCGGDEDTELASVSDPNMESSSELGIYD